MTETPVDYLQLLQSLDDPEHWEWPPDYNYDAAERRFLAFAAALQREAPDPLRVETSLQIQDASFLGQIFLQGAFLVVPIVLPDTVLLRVSNWGDLATVTDEAPIRPAALAHLRTLLREHGYTYVPPGHPRPTLHRP